MVMKTNHGSCHRAEIRFDDAAEEPAAARFVFWDGTRNWQYRTPEISIPCEKGGACLK